jgi:uncharacterized repeat protein (TIGR01451 family)
MSTPDHDLRTTRRRPIRRHATQARMMVVLGLLVPMVSAGVAALAPGAPSAYGVPPVPISTTFFESGTEGTYTVPAGITSLTITAVGAPGGAAGGRGGFQGNGGDGASVTATVPVTPNQTLYIEVGGTGMPGPCNNSSFGVSAFNGGGTTPCGGGGGGGSDVRTCSMTTCPNLTPDTRLVVAGGGGGGGGANDNEGLNGGQAGDTTVTGAGNGGTACDDCQTKPPPGNGGFGSPAGAGGKGDTFFDNEFDCDGGSGSLGQGGSSPATCPNSSNDGEATEYLGGAGGGGYEGGGAGGDAEAAPSGGGGSSFWVSSATSTSMSEDTTGKSEIVIVPDTVVSLTKGVTNASPHVGDSDTFTLGAADTGPADAGEVVVTDVLPAGLTYVSSSADFGTIGAVGQTVTWTIPRLSGTASGSTTSATAQIKVTIATSSPTANTATFTQTTPNDTGGFTGSSNTETVTPAYAVVSVVKGATTTTPVVTASGVQDAFTLTASNAGPNDAGAVVVTDALPPGLVFVSASTARGALSVLGQTVTWTIPDLSASGPNSSASLTINVNVTTPAATGNTATFTQTTPNASGGTTGSSNTVTVTASCSASSLSYHLAATSGTGNFTGLFCVNAAGSGLYLQSGGAHGTGTVTTSNGVTRISAFGTNLALIGQKAPSSSTFTETSPPPAKAGTFTLA